MNVKPGWFYLLDGWGCIVALLLAAALVIGPRVDAIWSTLQQTALLERRIADYSARLAIPIRDDQFSEYKKYVTYPDTPLHAATNPGAMQAALINLAQASGGRLVDLRPADTKLASSALTPLTFRLEIEGDLEAVLASVAAVNDMPAPIALETVELKPVPPAKRPEDRMRLVMVLTLWMDETQ